MNAVVREVSQKEPDRQIWWLFLDADEFHHGPFGMTLSVYLSTLDERFRVVGTRFFNHYPTTAPHYVSGRHPFDFQPLCEEVSYPMCSEGHRKHPLIRFDKDGAVIAASKGFHLVHCSDALYEPDQPCFLHHFPFRTEETTRRRLELLWRKPACACPRADQTPETAHMLARFRSLDAVYSQRWSEVVNFLALDPISLGLPQATAALTLMPWSEAVGREHLPTLRWYSPSAASHYDGIQVLGYGDECSYRKGFAFLEGHGAIEDWSFRFTHAKQFAAKGSDTDIDGSSPYADKIVDLSTSNTDCLFMRHVLEHTADWRRILCNAVQCFQNRMVLVISTPFGKTTRQLAMSSKLTAFEAPDISFRKEDITDAFAGLRYTEESVGSKTQYGVEHIFYLEKAAPPLLRITRTSRRAITSLSRLAMIMFRGLLKAGSEKRDLFVLFDRTYYLANNADVRDWRWPLLWHYLLFGVEEKRDPHPLFDSAFYLASYPDVARSGLNPLLHYILYGAGEGRLPNQYSTSSPSARCVRRNALVDHILRHAAEPPQYLSGGRRRIGEPVEANVSGPRRTSLSVSAVVLTKNGGLRLRDCLRSIVESHFADELVVCIDAETIDNSYAVAVPFTTRIHYVQTNGSLESALPQMVALCSGDYVLRVDDDECIRGLWDRETVESLACLNDVSHFLLATRWLIPPGDVFITDEPWFPDLHVRLFRRDSRLITYPEQIHSPMLVRGLGIVLWDRWIDHLCLVSNSRMERERKCEYYRQLRPDKHLSQFYLYEEQEVKSLMADDEGFRSALRQNTLWNTPLAFSRSYSLGEDVDFRQGGNSEAFTLNGWSRPEQWGTWTEGYVAALYLLFQKPVEGSLELFSRLRAFVSNSHPILRAQVEYGGQVIEEWSFQTGEFVERSIIIPVKHHGNRTTRKLVFRLVNPISPRTLEMSDDSRLLGLGFVTLRLQQRRMPE
jgi:hypothetical protein